MDVVKSIQDLQNRIQDLNTKKIGAEKELELLKKQHGELLSELQSLGVTDVSNLPNLISNLENELQNSIKSVEKEIVEIETQL